MYRDIASCDDDRRQSVETNELTAKIKHITTTELNIFYEWNPLELETTAWPEY